MNCRLNTLFLAKLAAGVVLLGACVHALHLFRSGQSARALLAQACRAEEQGRLDRALRLLTRYTLLSPEDLDEQVRRGLLLERKAKSARDKTAPLWVFEKVVAADPSRADVRRRLAVLAAEVGVWDLAEKHLTVLCAAAPKDPELARLCGNCREAAGDYDAAQNLYRTAIDDDAAYLPGYLALARLLRDRLRSTAESDEVLRRMLSANAGSAEAYIARIGYQKEQKRPLAEVAGEVSRALELAGDSPQALLLAGQLALEQKKYPEARARLRQALARDPREAGAYQALAAVELADNRRAAAAAWLRRGLEHRAGDPALLQPLVELLIDGKEYAAAQNALSQLRAAGQQARVVNYLEARLLAAQGKWIPASRLLEGERHQFEDLPAMAVACELLLGECYQHVDDDRQIAAFRRAVAADPASAPARMHLAVALLQSAGDPDAAVAELERLVRQPAAPASAWVVLTRVLVLKNLMLPPERRQWDVVLEALGTAARANPGQTEVLVLRAEVLAARGESAQARQLLERELARRPDGAEVWVALAGLVAQTGDPAGSSRVLDEAVRRLGDVVELRLARVRRVVTLPAAEARAALARAAAGWESMPDKDRPGVARALAEAYYELGDMMAAARAVRAWVQAFPGELRPRLLLFDVAVAAGDPQAMAEAQKGILDVDGGEPFAQYAEARRLIWLARHGDAAGLGDARRQLEEVARRRPGWSRAALSLAEIDELRGDGDAALEHYRTALEQGDRQTAVVRRVVGLLVERQRYQEADEAIRKLQNVAPISGELQKLAADVAARKPDPDRAWRLARQAVPGRPKDCREALWLGQILRAAGRYAEAETALRQAVELGRASAEPWVQLVHLLVSAGKAAQARAAVEEARRGIAPDQAPLALAECYRLLGQLDKAGEAYRAALAKKPGDVQALRNACEFYLQTRQGRVAIPLLRKMVDDRSLKLSGPDRAWARRGLALALGVEGDYAQFREALRLLQGNAGDGPGAAEDLRTRALVLLTRPCHRQEAIAAFEELARRQPLRAEEHSLLAQLCEAAGDWSRARDAVLNALAAEPKDPRLLAQYARVALLGDDRTAARLAVHRLEEVNPKSIETVALRCRELARREGFGEVNRLLEKYVAGKQFWPAEEAERAWLAAGVAEQVAQEQPAMAKDCRALTEVLCRRYVSLAGGKKPQATLALAEALARQGKVTAALDCCDAARAAGVGAEALAAAYLGVVQGGGTAEADLRRVDRALSEVAAKAPDSIPVRHCRAALCELLGRFAPDRYAAAEAHYRAVLDAQPSQVAALNNLAYLLALHGGDPTEALGLVDRAIAVTGPAAELLDTRAMIHLAAGRTQDALRDLARARAQQPRAAAICYHLAEAYTRAGRQEEAQKAFREARSLGLSPRDLHALEAARYQECVATLGAD
jgi:tetratricopeptide (TPR) repeat protein